MASVSNVAVSGMQAAQATLNSAAHNVANTNTPAFRRQQVAQTEQAGGGVTTRLTQASQEGPDVATDLVAQLQAKNAFHANLNVFKTGHNMTGRLLDKTA